MSLNYSQARDPQIHINLLGKLNPRFLAFAEKQMKNIPGVSQKIEGEYSCPEKFFPVIQMRCRCEERSSLPL
jgi:hypothetical protein